MLRLTKRVSKGLRKLKTDIMRKVVARLYLAGEGIEIGGLHNPLPVPRKASVRYVDRMSVDDLRIQYPELKREKLVHVDIIDNGELLETIEDETQCFVIANHFLEHSQNPLLAAQNMLRVLKLGGVLYVALPDKRYTFDAARPVTTLAHVIDDFNHGPAGSRFSHFEEWVHFVNGVTGDSEIAEKATALMEQDYSIHFHVWTQKEMLELFLYISHSICFDFEIILKNGDEVILVLRKSEQAAK